MSTTTVALAEILASEFYKRVLVVDLDPQTNATVMLIGEDKWLKLNSEGNTLSQLFKDALEEDPSKRNFDLDKTLQRHVSSVTKITDVDLLPSSLDLIDVQDRLGTMPSGRYHSDVPTDILRRAIRPIVDEYDFVLIDCPPNLGLITLNGLRISSWYLIPTIPDHLSTYGIPQIINRVGAFASSIGQDIDPLGIVISKYREQSTLHVNTLRRLRQEEPKPFNTIIPEKFGHRRFGRTRRDEHFETKVWLSGSIRSLPKSSERSPGQSWRRGESNHLKMNVDKLLRAVFEEIAKEASTNAQFALRLEAALGDHASADRPPRRNRRPAAVLDPFELHREGEANLRTGLQRLSIDELRDIVSQYGMDRAKLALKWKDTSRLVDLIVSTVAARAQKGDAFREPKEE